MVVFVERVAVKSSLENEGRLIIIMVVVIVSVQ